MMTKSLTIQLPEPIFRQFAEIAEQTQQPIETLVAQSVIHHLQTSLLEKLRTLPIDKQDEVTDFVNFLIAKATLEPQPQVIPMAQTIQQIDRLRTRLHQNYGNFPDCIELIRQDRDR